MNEEHVSWLGTTDGRRALDLAATFDDPNGLPAASALRAHLDPDLASAVLTQTELRRRARTKFGERAAAMLFTRDGLEQATRPDVAAEHAARFVAAGVERVVDLGCGIGTDAMAFSAAGLAVVAVELDPVTAAVARHNLGLPILGPTNQAPANQGPASHEPTIQGPTVEVIVGDAEVLVGEVLRPGTGVFCDPARRTATRRLWKVSDFTPSWDFVTGLLDGSRVAGVKLGPALPHSFVDEGIAAEWVSHRGDTVEVGLWAGSGSVPGERSALVLPGHRLVVAAKRPSLDVVAARAYLYEPDGAVIRAGGVTTVGASLDAGLLDPQIAYLTSDRLVATPYAQAFEVLKILPYKEKILRQWVAAQKVGTLEIKKRGLEVDPAALRRRLRPSGSGSATLVITRTPGGAQVLVVRRATDGTSRSGSQGVS